MRDSLCIARPLTALVISRNQRPACFEHQWCGAKMILSVRFTFCLGSAQVLLHHELQIRKA